MPRAAIVTPHSLGAIEAYRTVIKDISGVLGDPVIDMGRLFFAVMIQSGLEEFVVPEKHSVELMRSSLVEQRITKRDYAGVESVLVELDKLFGQAKRASLSEDDERALRDITTFVQDLYVAAEFRRPVVTVTGKPETERVRHLLREDVAAIVEGLLRRVETIGVEAPVAKMEVDNTDLKRFREVLESDAFGPYVERQELFEALSHRPPSVAQDVALQAEVLVRRFPSLVALRSTAVRALDVVP